MGADVLEEGGFVVDPQLVLLLLALLVILIPGLPKTRVKKSYILGEGVLFVVVFLDNFFLGSFFCDLNELFFN